MAGDRTDEIVAVMEALADWIDEVYYGDDDRVYAPLDDELVTAVWQILELAQLLMAEHGALQRQMHEFIGTLQMVQNAKAEVADQATQTIIANAGDAKRFIQE